MNKTYLFSTYILVLLITITPIFSQEINTPQVTSGIPDIDITYPKYEYVQQNTNFTLHTHLFNGSNGVPLYTQPSCYLHLYNPNGKHTIEVEMGNDDNGLEKELFINGGNFSEIGTHAYLIYCNLTSVRIGGFADGVFEVTENGLEPEINSTPLMIYLLAILFACLYLIKNSEEELKYVFLIGAFIIAVIATYLVYLVYGTQTYYTLIGDVLINNFYISLTILLAIVFYVLYKLIMKLKLRDISKDGAITTSSLTRKDRKRKEKEDMDYDDKGEMEE